MPIEGDILRFSLVADSRYSAVDDIDRQQSRYVHIDRESGEGWLSLAELLADATMTKSVELTSDMVMRHSDRTLKELAVADPSTGEVSDEMRVKVLTQPLNVLPGGSTALEAIMIKAYKVWITVFSATVLNVLITRRVTRHGSKSR